MVPLDKKKLDALLEEIQNLEDVPLQTPKRLPPSHSFKIENSVNIVKKDYLLTTEKKVYFEINHYYKLVMLSINDTATALEIWIKGVLPLLLTQNSIDLEEWDRICEVGDHNSEIEKEMTEDWKEFFQNTIQQGLVDDKILALINEGKIRVQKMREEK